jgi:hypothetical protein
MSRRTRSSERAVPSLGTLLDDVRPAQRRRRLLAVVKQGQRDVKVGELPLILLPCRARFGRIRREDLLTQLKNGPTFSLHCGHYLAAGSMAVINSACLRSVEPNLAPRRFT